MDVVERIHQAPDARDIRQDRLAYRAVQVHDLDRRAACAQVNPLAVHDQIVGGIAPGQRKRVARLRQRVLDQRTRDQHALPVGDRARRQEDVARLRCAELDTRLFQHVQRRFVNAPDVSIGQGTVGVSRQSSRETILLDRFWTGHIRCSGWWAA